MTLATSSNPKNVQKTNTWHVLQQTDGHCEIVDQTELSQIAEQSQTWGPFVSKSEAIAKRVGLIRSGKCLPQ
ncbi:MAG: hypothetical protein AAGF93_11110 [Cyanobacteria bacterium P01_H01_bin.105]